MKNVLTMVMIIILLFVLFMLTKCQRSCEKFQNRSLFDNSYKKKQQLYKYDDNKSEVYYRQIFIDDEYGLGEEKLRNCYGENYGKGKDHLSPHLDQSNCQALGDLDNIFNYFRVVARGGDTNRYPIYIREMYRKNKAFLEGKYIKFCVRRRWEGDTEKTDECRHNGSIIKNQKKQINHESIPKDPSVKNISSPTIYTTFGNTRINDKCHDCIAVRIGGPDGVQVSGPEYDNDNTWYSIKNIWWNQVNNKKLPYGGISSVILIESNGSPLYASSPHEGYWIELSERENGQGKKIRIKFADKFDWGNKKNYEMRNGRNNEFQKNYYGANW